MKGDFSAISVRNSKKEIVATLKAKCSEKTLARKIDYFFNFT
jgi:hypothetical protein